MIKVFTLKNKVTFSSEQLILFGLANTMNQENRYKGVSEFCKKNIEYVDDPMQCDILVFPYKFKQNRLFQLFSELARKLKKELLCFYNDDNDATFRIPSYVKLYRTSFYKSTRLPNEYPLVTVSQDYFKENYILDSKVSIGYCGHLLYGRKKYIEAMKQSNISTNFIIRKGFQAPGVDKQTAIQQFYENMEQNLFIFCYRGEGNFSYRFYETLMMGRIPIFIDTDCVIPNMDVLQKNHAMVYLQEKDIQSMEQIIQSIHQYYETHKDKLLDIQKNNRVLWETFYSPIGFLQNLIESN